MSTLRPLPGNASLALDTCELHQSGRLSHEGMLPNKDWLKKRSLRFCSNHIDCAWEATAVTSLTACVSLRRRLQQTVCSDTPMLQSARAQLLFSFCQAPPSEQQRQEQYRTLETLDTPQVRPPPRLDGSLACGFMILLNLHAIFCLPKPEALTRRPRHRHGAQQLVTLSSFSWHRPGKSAYCSPFATECHLASGYAQHESNCYIVARKLGVSRVHSAANAH